MRSGETNLGAKHHVIETALAEEAVYKRRIRQVSRRHGERERDGDRQRQGRGWQRCCCQHDARQDATHRRADSREVVSRTKATAVRLDHSRTKLSIEAREAKLLANLSCSQAKRSGGAADERKLNERLIIQRAKYRGVRKRSHGWSGRRQDDR